MKWLIIVPLVIAALIYLKVTLSFANKRKRITKRTGERWYRYASKEIFSERGQNFLKRHFIEALHPDRARSQTDRLFAQTAVLGIYFHLLDEKGEDATHYDTLPVDEAAVGLARIVSRQVIPSCIYKDVV